jgi:hypothetical protein
MYLGSTVINDHRVSRSPSTRAADAAAGASPRRRWWGTDGPSKKFDKFRAAHAAAGHLHHRRPSYTTTLSRLMHSRARWVAPRRRLLVAPFSRPCPRCTSLDTYRDSGRWPVSVPRGAGTDVGGDRWFDATISRGLEVNVPATAVGGPSGRVSPPRGGPAGGGRDRVLHQVRTAEPTRRAVLRSVWIPLGTPGGARRA